MTVEARTTTGTFPAGAVLSDSRKRQVVIAAMLAMFLAALDQMIVAPALATIGGALGDAEFSPWIISAYLLASTAVTPLYGKASDILGRRKVLAVALVAFILGSIVCALAGSMATLVIGRAVQGIGGGGLLTLAQTVVADFIAPRERARYVVYFSVVWATASIAGPLLGGFLAQYLSWTAIFWINLPLGAVALAMCDRVLRNTPQVFRQHRLDLLGAALIFVSAIGFMLALTIGGAGANWTSPSVLGLAAGSGALTVWLLAHLARSSEPLVPLAMFRDKVVGGAAGALFFSMFAYVGATVYLPLYFESVLGKDATTAGAGLVVLLGATVIGSNSAGRMMSRVTHYKRMAVVGLTLSAAALAVFAAFPGRLDFWAAEALTLVLGVGLGPLFPVATIAVQNAVDPRDLGVATAVLAFLRSFGGAIAVAILGAIMIANRLFPGEVAGLADPMRAAKVFRWVFATQAVAMAISLACIAAMAERALRGPDPRGSGPESDQVMV